MVAKLRLVFSFSILFLSFYGFTQQNHWRRHTSKDEVSKQLSKQLEDTDGKEFLLDENAFRNTLKGISVAKGNSKVVYFPDEKGKFLAFAVSESPVLAPELAARYPEIKSYQGYGVQDGEKKIRFSVSHKGIQSMIVHSDKRKSTFMQKNRSNGYIVYARDTYTKREVDFICKTRSDMEKDLGVSVLRPVDGQVLRKYRFAVSASGEYTDYHGGTVADALAAINATLTRINLVFETDLAVRLELVADNDKVIYTDSDTDPYEDNLNAEVQNALTNEIGEANYDIGHLFHRDQNGGNAGFIGRICVDGSKGSAYSAAQMPEGDTFDLDFVAHEVGHQLGANHTWSFESEGTQVQAEPGSGTTIMGYAGITGPNDVALNSDDYFHYYSIVQITENLESKSCGELIALANNPPVVEAVPDYIIPKSTAFVLTGSATDSDVDDVLSYTWEQIDAGVVTQVSFGPTNPSGANFRSVKPGPDPSRYFPRLARVLAGQLTQTEPAVNSAWETVSEIERELNFALTVRDNASGGGQVVSELTKVQVVNAAGPFMVTSQETSTNVVAGEVLEVTWDVANTNLPPVNAQSVDILLSTDGGLTYTPVAEGVMNDGTHSIIVPGAPTTQARLMVKAQENIFFAVNASNFIIESAPVVLNFSELDYDVCQPDELSIAFDYQTFDGFTEEATFSVSAPPGLAVAFSPATATDNDTAVVMTVSDTENVAVGSYTLQVIATTASETKQVPLTLNVFDGIFSEVVLVAPEDGSADVNTSESLQWEVGIEATSYDIEIATDLAFTNIVETASTLENSYVPISLENQTTYFWRVRPKNICGEGSFGTPFSFTTIQFNCTTVQAVGLPLEISSSGTPTVTSKITFFEDLPLADLDINLELDHSYLEDLVITLISPSGTSVALISNSCGDLQDIDVTFDDDANSFTCSGTPAISGTVKPVGALSTFNGESILGEWTLQISDTAPADGGFLRLFSMDVCVEGFFSPDEDGDGIFDSDDLCPGTPAGQEVDLTGCAIYRLPSDNFEVAIESESCRANNDGAIAIDANLPLEYAVTITGNGTDITDSFDSTYTLGNLSAGTYTICIIAVDGLITYEEVCFEVTLSEPEPLAVSSKVDAITGLLNITLEGADLYRIEFNGENIQTTEAALVLNLQKGTNSLKVTTDLACQGSYEEEFFLSDGVVAYPNPFIDLIMVNVQIAGVYVMEIYALNGQRIMRETKEISGTEAVLDVTGLSAGTYFLRVQGKTRNQTVKMIKR
ncbi:T9SS type A sorting domain-containing protein [Flavobacteriaceae bacterium TP-CH-4]|uniref:T9SS type A sorting domain-containing protein n=2 Tax=Pelagihabitans pacificus TaxID=2696054 RepID=A0A967AUS8_9FLAO|nr:T9SS type A sorting domain-containing protein [Pelagihabitans pacificus]